MNGACVRNNTCACSDGFKGNFCQLAGTAIIIFIVIILIVVIIAVVVSDCETNICENGANCKLLAGNYICECLPEYTGPFCGDEGKVE